MKFVGICLVTNSVPMLTDFYTKVLGVKAEGDDVHAELSTEGEA
jgi:catechol 2,3-dioxygenase-like lactoylglutathione lyase family enzyme